jgi:hypothetical protein
METEIYNLIKEYVFQPLIGHICSKLWHCLQKRLLNYINAIKAKRRKRGVGKHAPLFFSSYIHQIEQCGCVDLHLRFIQI